MPTLEVNVRQNVYLGMPLGENRPNLGADIAFREKASQVHSLYRQHITGSLISAACNALWCDARNKRRELGLQWFAMLHSDVEPIQPWFVDTLVAIAERHDADFLSAVIPHKDSSDGTVSTAIAHPQTRYGSFCRLTLQQVLHQEFPETFDLHQAAEALERLPAELRVPNVPRTALLCNTGCMICRLDRPWCNVPKVCFEGHDGCGLVNGQWEPANRPEDWEFTNRIAEAGGKVMATKAIKVGHWGNYAYRSDHPWGRGKDNP